METYLGPLKSRMNEERFSAEVVLPRPPNLPFQCAGERAKPAEKAKDRAQYDFRRCDRRIPRRQCPAHRPFRAVVGAAFADVPAEEPGLHARRPLRTPVQGAG